MITLATFDVLDKELTRDASSYLTLSDEHRWNNSSVSFQLDPKYWDEYYKKIKVYLNKFSWKEYKFAKYTNLDTIIKSNDIGMYMFVVRPDDRVFSLPQYVMYVGISGEGDSKRPLKERLNDYFNIGNIKKRTRLHGMLKQYYNNTWVVYTLLNGVTSAELEQLEEDFHGFFIPPAAERDFPVSIKKIIKAQFVR